MKMQKEDGSKYIDRSIHYHGEQGALTIKKSNEKNAKEPLQ
jgi:hypothetical protein